MRSFRKVLAVVLTLTMALSVLAGCSSSKVAAPNATTGTMEELVAYLQDQGYIAEDATPVNINETAGYLTDNTGGAWTDYAFADEAWDYDGIWLIWWDTSEDGAYADVLESMAYNPGYVLLGGGACVLELASTNGAFGIAFAEDYADKDAVLALFDALEN